MMASPAARSIVLATLTSAALSAHAADWRVTPSASSSVGYVDNPRLVRDGADAYMNYQGELSAPMSFDDGRAQVSLNPRFVYASYPDDPLLDRNESYVTFAAQRRYETATWSASIDFVRDTTLTSELGLTGLQQTNRPHQGLNLAAGPTFAVSDRVQLGMQLNWSDNTYRNTDFTGLANYRYSLGAINASYAWIQNLQLSLQSSFGRLEVPASGARSDNINATAALSWQYSELWRTQLSVGPSLVESGGTETNGYVYSVGATRQGMRSTFSASVSKDVTPTGQGVLVARERASLSIGHSLTDRISANASVGVVRNEDAVVLRGIGRRAVRYEYGNMNFNLNWRVTSNWSAVLSVGARTLSNDSTDTDASGYSAALGLQWHGDPRTRAR
jgi:hypothetical protein